MRSAPAGIAVSVAATGPGGFSLDHVLGRDGAISGLSWGVGVLGTALLVSALTLATRRVAKAHLHLLPRPPRRVTPRWKGGS